MQKSFDRWEQAKRAFVEVRKPSQSLTKKVESAKKITMDRLQEFHTLAQNISIGRTGTSPSDLPESAKNLVVPESRVLNEFLRAYTLLVEERDEDGWLSNFLGENPEFTSGILGGKPDWLTPSE